MVYNTVMITGIREFRKNLSNDIDVAVKGEPVFISKGKVAKPVAVLVNISLLETLAKKSGNKNLLDQISKEGGRDINIFSKYREYLIGNGEYFLSQARELKLEESYISKINTILMGLKNLLSEESTSMDKSLLFILDKKMSSLAAPVIDKDFYNINASFYKLIENEIYPKLLNQIKTKKDNRLLKDFNQIKELINKGVVSDDAGGEKEVGSFTSVLLSIVNTEKELFTYRIYTLLPFEYNGKEEIPNFINIRKDKFGKTLLYKKVGDEFKKGNSVYKVLGIT